MNPRLSVVIVSWNGKELLRVCLESLYKNLTDISFEIIVVDNGSTDGAPDMVKKDFPQTTLIETGENLYFAKANNIGFKKATGDYVLILNSDTEIVGNVLQRMIDWMEKEDNSSVAMVNPNIYLTSGEIQEETDYFLPSIRVLTYRFLLARDFMKRRFPSFYRWLMDRTYIGRYNDTPLDCEALMGCACLIRKSTLDEIDGYDEKYVHWFTDDEMCYRLKEKGYDLISLPFDRITHHHGGSTKILLNASEVFLKDLSTYLKDKVGWIGYVIFFPIFKAYKLIADSRKKTQNNRKRESE